jgi:hypothetical protein
MSSDVHFAKINLSLLYMSTKANEVRKTSKYINVFHTCTYLLSGLKYYVGTLTTFAVVPLIMTYV